MEYDEVIRKRFSVRKFSQREVGDDLLQKILEAGNIAPTSKNSQPQRIFVLKSEESRNKLANGCTPCIYKAPVTLLICHDSEVSIKRPADGLDIGETDTAIVTTHIMLAAAALGLGTCWVGLITPERLKEEFSLPDNLIPHFLLHVGYPAEDCPLDPRHFIRKPLGETVEYL